VHLHAVRPAALRPLHGSHNNKRITPKLHATTSSKKAKIIAIRAVLSSFNIGTPFAAAFSQVFFV
jgi:hypothetical protein